MTSRIPLEPRLAAYIRERIARFQSEATNGFRSQREAVERFGALPLHHGYETLGIQPDGALVRWSSESAVVEPIESPVDAAIAILVGGQHYPALRALAPERPEDVSDCLTCGGAGRIEAAPEFICECGGLGWWPRSLADLGIELE